MGTSSRPDPETGSSSSRIVRLFLPDGKVQTLNLAQSRWTLGRAGDNDFCYTEDAGISRHHLILEASGKEWFAIDAGTKNGVFLNGERISHKVRLRPNDTLTVSHLKIVFDPDEKSSSSCTIVFDATQEVSASSSAENTSLEQLIGSTARGSAEAEIRPGKLWTSPLDLFRRVGRELVLNQPLAELFQAILDLSIEAAGAERGVLLMQEGAQLSVQASKGDNFRISTTVRDCVMKERTSLLLRDVLKNDVYSAKESIISQHIRSLIAVPLQTDERVLGMIYVDSVGKGRRFSRDDLELLTIMANVAALRIERERLAQLEHIRRRIDYELKQAAEIQKQFLPADPPLVPGITLAGHNHACETIGGDCYSYLAYPDGRLAVMIGDVCGKGLSAALLMMSLQSRVQVLTEEVIAPAALLSRLNRSLVASKLSDRFISSFVAVLEVRSDRIHYCNAGHNPPLLLHAGGRLERLDEGGPVLGILPEAAYVEATCHFAAGDVLLLYSDGVTEAYNPDGKEYEEFRLQEFLHRTRHKPAEVICNELMEELYRWMDGSPEHDDITVVVARRDD